MDNLALERTRFARRSPRRLSSTMPALPSGTVTFLFAVAHARLAESLEIFKDLGDRRGIAFVLEAFAGLAAAEPQPLRAHCLAATATTLRRTIGAGPPPAWRADLEHSLGAASRGLSRDTIEEANARGRSMALPEAIAFALKEPSPPHA